MCNLNFYLADLVIFDAEKYKRMQAISPHSIGSKKQRLYSF